MPQMQTIPQNQRLKLFIAHASRTQYFHKTTFLQGQFLHLPPIPEFGSVWGGCQVRFARVPFFYFCDLSGTHSCRGHLSRLNVKQLKY
jgi:hypothetical protein